MPGPALTPASAPPRPATIKDVASKAGVSISTVSLVINGRENVRPATRERVLRASEALGFIPNAPARQLGRGATGNVGFVLRDDHFTRSEPFYTRIFLGTEFEARHQNLYILLTSVPTPYVPGQHTPRFLRERNVDGVMVAGKVDDALLDELAAVGLPVILIDYEAPGFASVTVDNAGGARRATEHLLEQGHTRLAFLGADTAHPSLAARYDGFCEALRAAGLAADGTLVHAPDDSPTRAVGRMLGERLLADHPDVTGAVCANDALALGLLDACHAENVAVPDRLAVVGFDDVEGAADALPPLTSVRVFKEQLGELALRHLADALRTPAQAFDRGRSATRVSTDLVVRASSQAPPVRS